MSNELQQIMANAAQNALNAILNPAVEKNNGQDEFGNIYDEVLSQTSETKTSTNTDNLSNQDKEAFEMLSQEKTSAAVQKDEETESVLQDIGNWFCGLFGKETKDGVIDETKQHSTGDCWLLSGVNALSYTEEGREIIKNSLDYEDGYTIVRLDGVRPGYCVIVDDEEIAATKMSPQYSSGDDDMIIFELAIEKTLNDVASGELVVDPNSPWYASTQSDVEGNFEEGKTSITGGYTANAMTLISGKKSEYIADKEDMRAKLEEFEQNGNKDLAIGASINSSEELDGTFKIKDVDGKSHKMSTGHAYAIKSVENGVVTVINPWNSGDEIPMNIDDFLELFSRLDVCDLSQNGEDISLAKTNFKFDKDGNRLYEFESTKSGYDKQIQTYTCDKDFNGSKIKDTYINEQTQDSLTVEYDEEGKETGTIETKHFYDEEGEDSGYIEYYRTPDELLTSKNCYDKNGNLESVMKYDENGNFASQTNYDENGKKTEIFIVNEDGKIIKFDANDIAANLNS